MKRILVLLLAVLTALCAFGCKKAEEAPATELTGSLSEIMETVYAGADAEFPAVFETEITEENLSYYLGVTELDYEEAIASEAMIGSIAHSVCLVRMNSGADIAAAKAAILENVNGYKWICVGVDQDKLIVDNIGNVIILIMVADEDGASALHESFLALAKAN